MTINLNDILLKAAISKEEIEEDKKLEMYIPKDAFNDSDDDEDEDEFEEEDEYYDYDCIDDEIYNTFNDLRNIFIANTSLLITNYEALTDLATKNEVKEKLLQLKNKLQECINVAENYSMR